MTSRCRRGPGPRRARAPSSRHGLKGPRRRPRRRRGRARSRAARASPSPRTTASCRAVQPRLLTWSRVIPACTRRPTIAAWPRSAARMSPVPSKESWALDVGTVGPGSAPAARGVPRWWRSGRRSARCRPAWLTSAPARISRRAAATSSRQAAAIRASSRRRCSRGPGDATVGEGRADVAPSVVVGSGAPWPLVVEGSRSAQAARETSTATTSARRAWSMQPVSPTPPAVRAGPGQGQCGSGPHGEPVSP